MITVHLRNLGMTPQKIRLIAKLIRGKKADEAVIQLQAANKRSSIPMLKLLKSGIDAAKRKDMDEKSLVISELIVNEGPKRKRGYAMSRGHVGTITKRSSHISLTLSVPAVVEKEKEVTVPAEQKSKTPKVKTPVAIKKSVGKKSTTT
ncbi:MAG: 50S ribosomal protein L22, large subunit ribosomal protein L22 [Parcubacteria group bacterium GW2011_GWC1_41_7]|nr:MAG: 50S ribosomal protein L22, large subunit ribosomal protein L22 [Parcubacteria group bacterium GW2011_GWC1_41_7]